MRYFGVVCLFWTAIFALPRPGYPPVPIVIWHGLGDRYDGRGLQILKLEIQERPALKGVYVKIVQLSEDGAADQKATFFGNANDQVDQVCQEILETPEITDITLNPSGKYDLLGFSQGGLFARALVERCGAPVRNLITLGSPHMGISEMPECPPGTPIFSPCRLMHLGIVKSGMYSEYAQHNIVPAQYWRHPSHIDKYLSGNHFLKDINNERVGDEQAFDESNDGSRNKTYKDNLSSLTNFVLFRFSEDETIAPRQSAHFTLPAPNDTSCEDSVNPFCYGNPLPWDLLPLYSKDYIGLKALDKRRAITLDVCQGVHMQIDDDCMEKVYKWFEGDSAPHSFVIMPQ